MDWRRLLKHGLTPGICLRRRFRRADREAIAAAIAASESRHRGELRFVAEGPLPIWRLLQGLTPRQRALELFGSLRIWDTEDNSGVLIYLQMVDRRVEVLADRGIAARVSQDEWDALCRTMERDFAQGQYRRGALLALAEADRLLTRHFPSGGDGGGGPSPEPNELPNDPVIL